MDPTITPPATPEEPEITDSEEEDEDAAEPAEDDSLSKTNVDANTMEAAEDVMVSLGQVVENGKNKEYTDLKDAVVTFTNNSVDSEGLVNKDAGKITFKVTPNTGKKLKSVQYALAETEEGLQKPSRLTSAGTIGVNTEYAVKEKITDLSSKKQMVRIYITVTDVTYDVTFSPVAGNADSAEVYLIQTDKEGNEEGYKPDKKAPAKTTIKFGETLDFAVTGLLDAGETDADEAGVKVTAKQKDQVNEDDILTIENGDLNTEGENEMPDYLEYTLDPSAVPGLNDTDNDAIIVTLDKPDKKQVTLKAGKLEYDKDAVAVDGYTGVDNEYLALEDNTSDHGYAVGSKIGFKVTVSDEKYSLGEITATYKATGSKTEESLSVDSVSDDGAYAIDLSELTQEGELSIKIATDLNEENTGVRTVSFSSNGHAYVASSKDVTDDPDNLYDSNKSLIGSSVKTAEDGGYEFYVEAEDGYAVTAVEVSFEKKYDNESIPNAEGSFTIDKDGKALTDESTFDYPFNKKEKMKVVFTGEDVDDPATEEDESANGSWSTRNVSVTVTTELAASVAESEITFISQDAYGSTTGKGVYVIEDVKDEAGKVEQKNGNTYTVAAGTSYVEFTVKGAESTPVFMLNGESANAIIEQVDGASYRIPASSLEAGEGVENELLVKRDQKNVKVRFNDAGSVAVMVEDVDGGKPYSYGDLTDDTIALDPDEESDFAREMIAAVSADAKVKITGKLASGKAPITAVTYQVGKDGTAQSVALKADGSFEFETKAADDIIVNVSKSTDRQLVVEKKKADGSTERISPEDDGAYHISYTDTLVASVYVENQAVDLYSTVVKVDGKNAATKAPIDSKDATVAAITVDKSERNKKLDVTLTTLKPRADVTFTIISDTAIDKVEYGGEVSDGTLSLMVDTKKTLDVTMTAEQASVNNLGVSVVTASDKKNGKIKTVKDGTYVTAAMQDGKLTITALPNKTGKGSGEKSDEFALYNTKDPDKTIIEGSLLTVKTTDAEVLTLAPTVTPSEVNTNKTLRLNITSPAMNEALETGSLWYEISVKAPSGLSKDVTAALESITDGKSRYYSKAQIDKNEGISLQVVKDGFTVPKKIEGFTVKVALVQAFDDTDIAYASAIIKKKELEQTFTLSTADPYYENTESGKLKIKNLDTTVFTGNTNWQAVATPQFDKAATYTYVDVKFVDVKSGETYGDTRNSVKAQYNDKTGNVEVRFTSSGNRYKANVDGELYKDLGLKVIAATENSGYGISDVVKLKFVNGIENISVTAQPYILKQAGKPASIKVNADLNGSDANKKYAPKNKNVVYEIVSADTDVDGYYNVINKAAGPAGVTVDAKSGKITVDKGYVVSKDEAKNQFKVLVKANDYAGNPVCEVSEKITITDKALALGGLKIMKKGTEGWSNATIVTGNQIEVTKITDTTNKATIENTAEYRAVMLQSDVAPDRATYPTNDVVNTVIDYAGLNFTPAKGGVYVTPEGYIVVSKLGKATIAAVDKNDKKNKSELKNLEFVQKNTKMILEVTQYKDSTFDEKEDSTYETTVSYNGNHTTYFALNVVEDSKEHKAMDLSDVKLTFKKNVKNITPKKDADWKVLNSEKFGNAANRPHYLIAVTGDQAAVLFKSKTMGDQEYSFINNTFPGNKAPKLAPLDKKMKVVPGVTNTLSYTVTSPNKGENLEGMYVMLSLDGSKKNPEKANVSFNGYLDRVIPIRDGSLFDFEMYPWNAGNYALNVAVGTLTEGVFKQEYADAKLSVKVAKAGSVNLKVTGKYTLDPQIASKVDIEYNKKDHVAWFVNTPPTPERDKPENFAMNAIINNQENHFRDYFIAEAAYKPGDATPYIGTIGLRDDVSVKKLEELVNAKSTDLIGYIRVYNGSKQVDVKITIGYKAVKSLKASSVSIISGSDMTLDVQLYDGKNYVPVKNDYEINDANFKKDAKNNLVITREVLGRNGKVDADASGGDIRLKAANVPEGKYTLSLKVTPYYATAKDTAKFTVEVPVTVMNAEKAKNKIVFAKGMNNWVVSNSDFVSYNSKVKDDPAQGKWQTKLPYTFKNPLGAEDMTINVQPDSKVPYVTFESDKYFADNKSQLLTVTINKELLEASVDGKKLKWGGKVTVKPTFTYGDEKNPSKLPNDTASITITLPGQPAGTENVKADIDAAKGDIQYVIDTMYAHYNEQIGYDIASDIEPDYVGYSNDIADRVKARIIKAIKGAAADVTVTPEDTKGLGLAAKYTVAAKDAAGKELYKATEFTAKGETGVWSVVNRIATLSGITVPDEENGVAADWTADWTELKKDPELKKLLTLSKDTTASQYAKMLKDILAKDGNVKLTSNIGISVETLATLKAPTTKAPGLYPAKVTVTDRSVTPNRRGTHSVTITLETSLEPLETIGEADTRLQTAMKADKAIQEIVGGAWTAASPEPGQEPDIDNAAFREALIKSIEEKAAELLAEGGTGKTGNSGLTAKVDEDTLRFTATDGKVSVLAYTLILSEGDTDKEVSITSPASPVKVDEIETPAQLLERLQTELTVIKNAQDNDTVRDAVIEKIKTLSRNKAYDVENTAKVTKVTDLLAPNGTANGLVTVTVKLGEELDETGDIENIVILTTGDDFSVENDGTLNDDDIKAKKAFERAKALVELTLTDEAVQGIIDKLVADAVKAGTDVKEITADEIFAAIAEAVGGATGKDGILKEAGYKLAVGDGEGLETSIQFVSKTGKIEIPKNAATAMKIPDLNVMILPAAETDVKKAEAVKIKAKTLKPIPVCQSWTEAAGKIKSETLDYIKGIDKFTADQKTEILAAVMEVLNARLTNDNFTAAVKDESAVKITKGEEGKASYLFDIKDLTVTITDKKAATSNNGPLDKPITLKIKFAEKTEAAKDILFTTVGDVEIEWDEEGTPTVTPDTNGDGTAAGTAVALPIEGTTDSIDLAWDVAVTEQAGEDKAEEYRSAVTIEAVDNTTNDAIEGVYYDAEEGKLMIPEELSGDAKHELMLKVTGTLEGKGFGGENVTNDLYIKLTFEPAITEIKFVKGPNRIEVTESGSGEIPYEVEVVGRHLLDTEKAALEWTSDELKTALTAETDKTKAKVKLTDDTITGDATIKVTPTTAGLEGEPGTLDITIEKCDTEDKPAITLDTGSASTITVDTLKGEDLADGEEATTKLILEGKNAKIPLKVDTSDDISRKWEYTLTPSDAAYNSHVEVSNMGSYLYIKDSIDEIADETESKDEDGKWDGTENIPTFTLKATSVADTASGTNVIETSEYKFALVVKKTVNGVKVVEKGSDSSDTEDTGSGTLEVVKGNTLYLQPALSGYHIKDADKHNSKLSISYRSKSLAAAAISKVEGKDLWKVEGLDATGYIRVLAKEGTGENAVTTERLIQVKANSTTPPTPSEATLKDITVAVKDDGTAEVTKGGAGLTLTVSFEYNSDGTVPTQKPTLTNSDWVITDQDDQSVTVDGTDVKITAGSNSEYTLEVTTSVTATTLKIKAKSGAVTSKTALEVAVK